jgi:hypothetical protein
VNAAVNPNGKVNQHAHTAAVGDSNAQTRKILEQLDVAQQSPSETFGSRSMVGANIRKENL